MNKCKWLRAPGVWLVWVWAVTVPLSHVGLYSYYAWRNELEEGSWALWFINLFPWLPPSVATLISVAVGLAAIWQRRRGISWSEQSSLAQATGIFTISLGITWAILCVLIFAMDWSQPPGQESYYLKLFKPYLVGAFTPLLLGLTVGVLSLGVFFVGAAPPAILCAIILKRYRPSPRAFRILLVMATVAWLATAVLGFILASG